MFHLQITTLEKIIFEDDVAMVMAPGVEGELGILPNHAPLITALKPGEIRVKLANGEEILIAIYGGFMEVNNNLVKILADAAERAEEIDLQRAEEARQRAQKLLEEKRADKIGYAEATALLERSLLQLKIARKHHSKRGVTISD
jgi:F-type H+-transporting ATPase subunit epsilon